jgi:hypothetical protein
VAYISHFKSRCAFDVDESIFITYVTGFGEKGKEFKRGKLQEPLKYHNTSLYNKCSGI